MIVRVLFICRTELRLEGRVVCVVRVFGFCSVGFTGDGWYCFFREGRGFLGFCEKSLSGFRGFI